MASRAKKTPQQRIGVYVDSPMMTQRVRFGKQLAARIHGNFGVYRTSASQRMNGSGDCTCPSEEWPCKHIKALRQTWKINPPSFFDVDQFLAELHERPKAELVKAIGQIVIQFPECLGVFGVAGFEEEEEDITDW